MPRTPENQRAYKQTRYAAYKKLCSDRGVKPQYERWWGHYAELTGSPAPLRRDRRPNKYAQATVLEQRRLTREEHFAFWTERLTPQEIREIGSCLDFLDREAVAA